MGMTPLAMKEVSPHYCQIMVAKRKRVDRLIAKGSAHPKVSPSRSAAEGARRDSHQKVKLFSVWLNGLLKPTDDVGQQLNDKFKVGLSQSSKIENTCKIKDRRVLVKFLVKLLD